MKGVTLGCLCSTQAERESQQMSAAGEGVEGGAGWVEPQSLTSLTAPPIPIVLTQTLLKLRIHFPAALQEGTPRIQLFTRDLAFEMSRCRDARLLLSCCSIV